MAFFFFLCRIQYTFFSRVILSFSVFSFSNRYAWSSNGKTPTIYQFISIWNFFRIQLVVDPDFGRNFFQVSLSRFRLHLKGRPECVFAFGHLHQPFLSSDLLCRYVSRIHMHWITHDKKTWMKETHERFAVGNCEAKKTEKVWTCRNIQVSVGNRNSSLRSLARSFGPIILHYISPPDSFAVDFEILQLMASSKIA